MRTRKRHISEFIEALAGPAIFIVYFGLSYGVAAVSQAEDPRLLDAVDMRLALMGLTIGTLIILAIITMVAVRQRGSGRPGDEEDRFLAGTTLWLNLLSAVAVAWTGVPAALFAF